MLHICTSPQLENDPNFPSSHQESYVSKITGSVHNFSQLNLFVHSLFAAVISTIIGGSPRGSVYHEAGRVVHQ